MSDKAVKMDVVGLREMRRDLKRIDNELVKGLNQSLKEAAQPIVDDARHRYRLRYPKKTGSKTSEKGMRAAISYGGAAVRIGRSGKRYRYLIGQEFGAKKYKQFPTWRPHPSGRGARGYFFWPAINDGADDVHNEIEKVLKRATRSSPPLLRRRA